MKTIEQLRQQCGPHASEVCERLGCDYGQLAEGILLGGLEYLASLEVDTDHLQKLSESKAFWNWYKMYWYATDAELLAQTDADTLDEWIHLHVDRLQMNHIYPPVQLMSL